MGSSPLTRGILSPSQMFETTPRFIPAHAGNTESWPHSCLQWWVHPRSRGEYSISSGTVASQLGSSPLTRGILKSRFPPWIRIRFIPAHAGNTLIYFWRCFLWWVHPRSRGEYILMLFYVPMFKGSSPLTRGILQLLLFCWRLQRFIPAHAGNTLKKALFYLTFSNTHFHISFNFWYNW